MDKPKQAADLTVLVFKDNLAARTFRVPIRWISQLGLLMGIAILLAVVFSMLAVRYYREAKNADPSAVVELERRNRELRVEMRKLKADLKTQLAVSPSAGNVSPGTSVTAQTGPAVTSPTDYLAFPSGTFNNAASNSPVALTNVRTQWKGSTLNVRFYIHYSASDGGSQQGRFILLARGGSFLQTYPANVITNFQQKGQPLFSVEKGEYFSVSRFREVTANFGPVSKKSDLQTIQTLIFDRKGRLVFQQDIPTNGPRPNKKQSNTSKSSPNG